MFFQGSFIILGYHSIDDSDSSISVSRALFRQQMYYLKKTGFQVKGLSEILRQVVAGKKLPPKTLAITFDDGYLNNFTEVFPLLKTLDFPATIFLATAYIGKRATWIGRDLAGLGLYSHADPAKNPDPARINREMLRVRLPYLASLSSDELWPEINKLAVTGDFPLLTPAAIEEMSLAGIEFGCHSHTHPFLNELNESAVGLELDRSQEIIVSLLGRPAEVFCYPYGAVSGDVKRITRQKGFLGACTVAGGVNQTKHLDRFALQRIMMNNFMSPIKFRLALSGFYQFLVAVQHKVKSRFLNLPSPASLRHGATD